jgi:lipoprotein-anchoring transpeptidase ErfK/SrfK
MLTLNTRISRALAVFISALVALTLLAGAAQAKRTFAGNRGKVVIKINKRTQRMTVHVGGVRRYVFRVSTGKAGYRTPGGAFRPLWLTKMHYSRKYNNAPMPNSIFFTRRGHAIHGTSATGRLGRTASHGCVRLSPRNAAALYALVKRYGRQNVTIRIV